jgi:hypothetical protein
MILEFKGYCVICFHCGKGKEFRIQKKNIICKVCNKIVGYLGDMIE